MDINLHINLRKNDYEFLLGFILYLGRRDCVVELSGDYTGDYKGIDLVATGSLESIAKVHRELGQDEFKILYPTGGGYLAKVQSIGIELEHTRKVNYRFKITFEVSGTVINLNLVYREKDDISESQTSVQKLFAEFFEEDPKSIPDILEKYREENLRAMLKDPVKKYLPKIERIVDESPRIKPPRYEEILRNNPEPSKNPKPLKSLDEILEDPPSLPETDKNELPIDKQKPQ
tara:strand:- start:456 stop:1151 length:696 start_codon:yes stop_codon:yes gene_type:complete